MYISAIVQIQFSLILLSLLWSKPYWDPSNAHMSKTIENVIALVSGVHALLSFNSVGLRGLGVLTLRRGVSSWGFGCEMGASGLKSQSTAFMATDEQM